MDLWGIWDTPLPVVMAKGAAPKGTGLPKPLPSTIWKHNKISEAQQGRHGNMTTIHFI